MKQRQQFQTERDISLCKRGLKCDDVADGDLLDDVAGHALAHRMENVEEDVDRPRGREAVLGLNLPPGLHELAGSEVGAVELNWNLLGMA